MNKRNTRISASELAAKLEADPDYQGRMLERDHERRGALLASRTASRPIVDELNAAGISTPSLEALRTKGTAYSDAIPILITWLARVEDEDVKQEIVRCLSVPYAKPDAALPLIAAFRKARDTRPTGLRWAIGNALEVVADDAVLDEMIELATNTAYGKAREMIVLGLGNLSAQRVTPVLLGLLDDEQVNGHAIIALGKLAMPSARVHIKPFLKHSKSWVRNEAKKAIARIDKLSERS